MKKLKASSPITAMLYSRGCEVDPVMLCVASYLEARGLALAGFVQRNSERPGRRHCNMVLEDLATGERIAISEDRGALARGCHLKLGELMRSAELGRAALDAGPDLLIINKFGKSEGEGGGFRSLIAEGLQREVPVLVAVPWRNIDSWRLFAGSFAREVPLTSLPSGERGLLAVLGFDLVEPATQEFSAHGGWSSNV